MNLQDFYQDLPGIWLVFADSYLSHNNFPKGNADESQLDNREKILVDLLRLYITTELASPTIEQLFGDSIYINLTTIHGLLELWSEDLKLIYKIRKSSNPNTDVAQVAHIFLQRVQVFEDCCIIPNGLISAGHTETNETIHVAILKKRNKRIDWIQVNPGGLYHQHCPSLTGEKCSAYFEIQDIDVDAITEDWLYLLVGLKSVKPGKYFYKERTLYECLLAHLNGKTTFQSQPDESFSYFCHTSPGHTWQVIDQSFRYLLQHFLGETYHVVYWRLLIGFKLFLMAKTFVAYKNKKNEKIEQCHYLLQEMCRQISQLTLEYGNQEQIAVSLMLIDAVKEAIGKLYSEQNREIESTSHLDKPYIFSLRFVAPTVINHTDIPSEVRRLSIEVDFVFIKPKIQEDIIEYLERFKCNFVDRLVRSSQLKDLVLLSYGIEEFFIDNLAKTDILQTSQSPFSNNDTYLAQILIELAEIYYGCLGILIQNFLSDVTSQPQFYAKNVTIQFFVYAVVAALNLRHKNIGPLLSEYNLCTASNKYFTLNRIVSNLVIHDYRYLKVLSATQAFFTMVKNKKVLFSYKRFLRSQFSFRISNDAEESDTDVAFAYKLLQTDYEAHVRFYNDFCYLEDEKFYQKWQKLICSDTYLPSLYYLLSKMAIFARATLKGFLHETKYIQFRSRWWYDNRRYWQSTVVTYMINNSYAEILDSNRLMSYLIKSGSQYTGDPYQQFIVGKNFVHLSENSIIAGQDEKPATMDCVRYMHLGFLQSEPFLKFERLYIAIKDQQLDFSCVQESTLIKQTLFEVSVPENNFCSLLGWTVNSNPCLIHKLGLLCIEKALTMKFRLTQHPAISDILEVLLGLLTFYPLEYKNEYIENIANIYHLLKAVLDKPPSHLSDNTLLYLNAYLVISVQAKPQLIETEALTVLQTLLAINNYKVKGLKLDNNHLLRIHISIFTWRTFMEHQLKQGRIILNKLMLSILPQWDQTRLWQNNETGLFICGDYTVQPFSGLIYFQNLPITGLPDTITEHRIFKEYLGKESFVVMPGCRKIGCYDTACYISVDRELEIRLTLVKDILLIEERIDGNYQLYESAQKLLGQAKYPKLFYQLPHNEETLRHWLKNDSILIKDQQRQIIYQWELQTNTVFSFLHQGYIIPWKELLPCYFKTWLEQIEISDWIEMIAKQPLANSAIGIESLHFPRLNLDFDVTEGTFSCRQIHGYYLAKQQYLNILQGFSNYLILEKENSKTRLIKIIIPHREIKCISHFYTKTTIADLNTIRFPSYFVYDLDQKTGLLKANHIRAQLYLALLYYCSASLDYNDISYCNAYHLARENLEICWKDQCYDKIELDIIEQFLSQETRRGYHSHHVALYLKVVSLLSSSLQFAYLYTDQTSLLNKERQEQLLKQSCEELPRLFILYLQKKNTIFTRIRLNVEEEEEILKHCLVLFSANGQYDVNQPELSVDKVQKNEMKHCFISLQAYQQLCFENRPQISLFRESKFCYKKHYQELFSKERLNNTSFLDIFQKYIENLSFSYDTKGLDFSTGFSCISNDRFSLMHFLTLYKLAKSSVMKLTKYRYLLHHTVLRAETNQSFPPELVMMLARSLLLVAENSEHFSDAPSWFNSSNLTVNLFKRKLTQNEIVEAFPSFVWEWPRACGNYDEDVKAREKAKLEDRKENDLIWSSLTCYDLDNKGIPHHLPSNQSSFSMEYESQMKFNNISKQNIVRQLYLKAARNDAMYQFFVLVLKKCDGLKYNSAVGWTISSSIHNAITVTIMADKLPPPQTLGLINLEKEAISQQPLVDLTQFFVVQQHVFENKEFLLEAQSKEPPNGYQQQFYSELKDSWVAYHNKTELIYHWINSLSVQELETNLQKKHMGIKEAAKKIWNHLAHQFKLKPNSESDHYFALRWHSGQVPHYHKGDLLTLLVKPHKIIDYNPACLYKKDIIKDLVHYVYNEINADKIVRVLTFIDQYKQAGNESERFSIVQCVVKCLQENLDSASYSYPHWLLFQLENDVIVRNNQQELIVEMLNQTEKRMYQLNMGEGKSSVILPLLSYNLTNGKQLLRINVLSSLLITMKDFLRQRFSGLLKKRIYTLPFYRNTDISLEHLTFILQTLKTCQLNQHILLVTPEYRLCLQLKERELMIENQQQMDATGIFNWHTYRRRAQHKPEVYEDLADKQKEELLSKQDQLLKNCLHTAKYIDEDNLIIQVPPRGQERKEFAQFKEDINDPTFREWSCLKAAYRELLYNSKVAYVDSSKKLALLNEISELTAIDLLDESDEILKHGTELNYTLGDKYMFSGGEFRWQIPQFLIKTIFCDPTLTDIIIKGKDDGFTSITNSSQAGVPFIQFFNETYYEENIKLLLIEKFFSEHLHKHREYCKNIDENLVEGEVSSLKEYIAGQLPLCTEKKIVAFLADKSSFKDKLFIAKGWLSHGILFHVFNTKYRVQYGLAIDLQGEMRKQVAIPFWGKDMPSPRSEFSHPDVMLGCTIISYLYQGLNKQQLKETLLKLKNKFSHQVADTLLKEWGEASRDWIQLQAATFPPPLLTSFQHLDLADEECLAKVHQFLSGNLPAIYFYLNQFVLLQEAMQYRFKISANAHSLVGYNGSLGFSGTDDRKLTMPFQIKSLCSMSQMGTNGKVLSVLAEERNRHYYSVQTDDTDDLLKQLCHYMKNQPHCHALIDAGALVTGLTNYEVALFLINELPSTFLGILYFSDEGNNLTVLTRDKKNVALQDCYLDKQYLFAYLDDVHTRGTDIQLPMNCHAILTIGMGMQKDKLMQAAMRLRQLANKQSVSLWGTHFVTLAIARGNQIDPSMINSLEVIQWVTRNTVNQINVDLFPVLIRKINFLFLQKAECLLKEAPTTINPLIRYCQERELFTLEDFYALSAQQENLKDYLYRLVDSRIRIFWQDLEQELTGKALTHTAFYKKNFNLSEKDTFRKQLYTICNELAVYLQSGYIHNSLDTDEEKEVEVEIVQERQFLIKREKRSAKLENEWNVQLILKENFVALAEKHGIIMPITAIRHFVQLPVNLKNIIWHPDIYMTSNFVNSVETEKRGELDNYLRPVDVVLIHHCGDKNIALLLSGHEASQVKSKCYGKLNNNVLVHISDIDGPSQLPIGSTLSKHVQRLLTIIKLFSGECQYSSKEVECLAQCVGHIYPDYFTSLEAVINNHSQKLYEILIQQGYLDSAGIMTEKLLKVLAQIKIGEFPILDLTKEYELHNQHLLKRLYSVYDDLIIQSSSSLKDNHYILWQWIGTRGRLKEYPGSTLQSILNT